MPFVALLIHALLSFTFVDLQTELERESARVFASMHDDFLRCLATSKGSAFIGVEVVLTPNGNVRRVKTTGGALAGERAMSCIERRIIRARFPRSRDGAANRVTTSFAYRSD